tara:strand:+ start:11212 stop:14262 length:3051 start_codon:yes stop_codon:yes gene_type:complete
MGLNNNPTFKPQIAQIADEDSYLKTFPNRKFTQEGTGIMLRRYKIRICSMHDANTPINDLPWAYGQSPTSGLRGESVGTPFYPANTFVTVFQDPESGLFYIDNVHANSVDVSELPSGIGLKDACAAGSGFIPGSANYFVPRTHYKDGGLVSYGEWGSIPRPSDDDDAQDLLNETVTLPSKCRKVNTEGVNSEIEKLKKEVENIRTGLLGEDSFLQTSQNFVNDVQEQVNLKAASITRYLATFINEMRAWILRKVNAAVNNAVGGAPLSSRYIANEAADGAINTISCLFAQFLQNLEDLVAKLLKDLIDKIIGAGTCIIENILGSFIGQILNKLLGAINSILGPISSLLGKVISFTTEVLDFIVSILDIFTCKIDNICPVTEEWNWLEGGNSANTSINFLNVFDSAKGIMESAENLVTPPNFDGNFNLDINAKEIVDNAVKSCGLGGIECGPPQLSFFGGRGTAPATGNVIIGLAGEVIGVDLLSGGNYTALPSIAFKDACGNGRGAIGIPVFGDPIDGGDGGAADPGGDDGSGAGPGGDDGSGGGPGGDDGSGGGPGGGTTPGSGGGPGGGTPGGGTPLPPPLPGDGPGRPIVDIIIQEPGYGYIPSPDGGIGNPDTGQIVGRCQTIVQRANGDVDPIYSEGQQIQLFFGDRIKFPAKDFIEIDCDWNIDKIPGALQYGEPVCLKEMDGFDDGTQLAYQQFPIKSMVGFDDRRGSTPAFTVPLTPEHQARVDALMGTTEAQEAFKKEKELQNQGGLPVPWWDGGDVNVGRPDQFGFMQDYPYAKELGFSDADIRFYLEGFYSKLLGKRLGPLMQVVLKDPNFGPLPKYLTGEVNTGGLFDCENDYPYAISLGYTDQDIRYYLENDYPGEISACMQGKLDDPDWGRYKDFYVTVTAPGCPDGGIPDDNTYETIPEIEDIIIQDPGFGYGPGDSVTVIDCEGNPDASTQIEITVEGGRIVAAKVIHTGSYACIPKFIINTSTGHNAKLLPLMKFTKVDTGTVPEGTSVLQVVDCVGKV